MSSQSIQLQSFCRIIQGGRHGLSGNHFVPEGFPAYGAGGLNGYLPEYEFDVPAVILSAIGARCGKCFYPEGKWTSLANTQLIFPDPAKADARFLWFQLDDERRWHRSGTGQPFIKPADVKSHRVYLPSLPEQRRIAAILDKADALRAKRRAALAKLDTLAQSIFLDMFGEPATNPKGWPVRAFDETMRDETSRAQKLQRSDYLPEGRYPVVDQGQSVIAGYCDDERYLSPTELPVVVFGDHTRAVKLVRHRFVVGADGAKVLAPEPGVEAVYLSYLMRELPIPDLGYSRHMRAVKRLGFPTPPLARQREFAQRVAAIEEHGKAHDRSQRALDSLFASLQHRAFRGELTASDNSAASIDTVQAPTSC